MAWFFLSDILISYCGSSTPTHSFPFLLSSLPCVWCGNRQFSSLRHKKWFFSLAFHIDGGNVKRRQKKLVKCWNCCFSCLHTENEDRGREQKSIDICNDRNWVTVISGSNERKTFLIARTRPSRREIMNETLCQYATHNNSSPLDQAIIHWHLILRHVSRSHRHQSFSPQTRKFSSCLFIFKQHSIHHRPSGNQRRKKHCRSERTFFFFSSHAEIISPQHTTRQWWWWWRCERK